MSVTRIASLSVTLAAMLVIAGCGNTIRGVGHDVGNVIDATQDAGRSVVRSAR